VRLASMEQLRQTDLEWTRFYVGFFLDYLDIPNKTAAIPGTGNDVLSFITTRDIATFVVKSLDLPKWEEESCCYGEKATWNQILKLAEEATGRHSSFLATVRRFLFYMLTILFFFFHENRVQVQCYV
jgi:nucleoside-diphosphate-sugar epimerase